VPGARETSSKPYVGRIVSTFERKTRRCAALDGSVVVGEPGRSITVRVYQPATLVGRFDASIRSPARVSSNQTARSWSDRSSRIRSMAVR
jgi:hypothetical protein